MTIDQLLVFSTIVDAGSFSAAARQLKRTQGAISYNIATLEGLLDVSLFDRTGRRPLLTERGRTLLSDAKAVLDKMASLNATVRGFGEGLEPSLSIAVDTLYPPLRLAEAVADIERAFPTVPLDLRTGILSAVTAWVQNGECDVGITGLSELSPELVSALCTSVELIAVAAPCHPIHLVKQVVGDAALREHVNIVLSDHTPSSEKTAATSASGKVWRINDSEVRRELVRAGLGWARMPKHQIAEDIAQRTLVKLPTKRWKRKNTVVELRTIYRREKPPGPAGRRFLEQVGAG